MSAYLGVSACAMFTNLFALAIMFNATDLRRPRNYFIVSRECDASKKADIEINSEKKFGLDAIRLRFDVMLVCREVLRASAKRNKTTR